MLHNSSHPLEVFAMRSVMSQWSQMEKESTIHWTGWQKLTKPKVMVEQGFTDIHSFNFCNSLSASMAPDLETRKHLCESAQGKKCRKKIY